MTRGKKISLWDFTVNGVKVSIPVRMRRNHNDQDEFYVLERAYALELCDDDINALKRATREHLQTQLQITWERFYYLTIDGQLPDEDDGDDQDLESDSPISCTRSCKFSCQEIEIGTKPDGSTCWRPYNDRDTPYSNPTRNGMPEVGVEKTWRHDKEQKSLVPATPANKAAIEKIQAAFQQLNKKLYEFLSPEKVEKNLVKTAGLLQLKGK